MFWLLIGLLILLVLFDAIITMRRRPQWRQAAEDAHAHLRRVAPSAETARMDRETFVNKYLELCQKATTGKRLAVITGLGLLWLVSAVATSAVQAEKVGLLNYFGMAVILVGLPAPVLIKMVGVRQAKRFAQPPAAATDDTSEASGAE